MSRANEAKILRHFVDWAQAKASIRALILTSTRSDPAATLDAFSDYDLIVAVTDIQPFLDDESWLEDFGKVLTLYRDPVRSDDGFPSFCRVTMYEDGTKVDYTVYAVERLRHIVALPELPDDLDIGYRVLVDKDGLTAGLKPPTCTAYIPSPPTQKEYDELVQAFLSETTYVAKNLWRGETIFFAKFNLDYVMKFEVLRRMLEWRMEIDHGWSKRTSVAGKGLHKQISPEIWSALEKTYVGAGDEENWIALFETIELFRTVAVEVGDSLGFTYPEAQHQRVAAYLQQVKELDRDASSFEPHFDDQSGK